VGSDVRCPAELPKSRPQVTVVIPTRDRWPLLSSAALPSALGQEDVDLEVVVVDDGSTDETPVQLRSIADERLRTVRHESPRGVASARNAGIEAARGEWIAFLDDDDLWAPWKLRRQLDAAVPDASFVYCGAVVLDKRSRVLEVTPAPDATSLLTRLLERNVIPGASSNVIASSALIRAAGGFDETLFQLDDWDLWIRLAAAGRAAACEDVCLAYSLHPANMLLTSEEDVMREARFLEHKFEQLRREQGVDFDWYSFLRWRADGYRRGGRRLLAAQAYLDLAIAYRSFGDLGRAASVLAGSRPFGVMTPLRRVRSRRSSAPSWLRLNA
jgi:glycosyltransferase involved in cell wall biosynthesis